MLLPTTYWSALALAIVSMLCWGSWANTYKASGSKWRFELFYFDYAFGVLLTAVLAAFTLGEFGTDFLSFTDNISVSPKRNMAYATAGGVVFNLANMLLVAAIAISGMSVAFPISIGLALVIGVFWNYYLSPQGNPAFLFSGVGLVLLAIIVNAMAWRSYARTQAQNSGKKKSKSSAKGIVVSLLSGVLMGAFYPIVELSKLGDLGLGPYAVAFCFALGVFFSTPVFSIYFMNLPVQGKAVDPGAYFQGTGKQHGLGVLGGIIWCAGTIANFAAASTPKTAQAGPAVSYALGQGATLVSALWGLLVWKEFAGAEGKVPMLLALMLALFVAGLALVSLAPVFAS
jgi:glucose uptake protein